MTDGPARYPLAENAADELHDGRGRPFAELTLEAVLAGDVTMEDLRITPDALRRQAGIARGAGRMALAMNLERGAELVDVPQEVIMQTYELLRPGRAASRAELLEQAAFLRRAHGAEAIAAFLETAARHYHRRGILRD